MSEPVQPMPTSLFRPQSNRLFRVPLIWLYFFAPTIGWYHVFTAVHKLRSEQATQYDWMQLISGLLFFATAVVFVVGFFWRRFEGEYELSASELVIDLFYKKQRIQFAEINGVRRGTKSDTMLPKSTLRISYSNSQTRRGFAEVAPRDLELFLSELSTRCPHLIREGNQLLPAESTPTISAVCA